MGISKVGVVGCGLMGSGIVEVVSRHGHDVTFVELNEQIKEKSLGKIRGSINRGVERGKLSAEDRDAALSHITASTSLNDLADADIVIEAITENIAEKQKVFAALDGIVRDDVIIASNTSSITIMELAAACKPARHAKVCGLHFFNPVPVMALVELVKTIVTSEETLTTARAFAEALDKTVILAKDTPGFVVNVLLVPYLLDAVRLLENGVATREDIDQGMKLGCNMPMGPLTLLDFVGVDTTYYIAEVMFAEFKDSRYAAPTLMKRMTLAGHHGRKTGKGFYDYGK